MSFSQAALHKIEAALRTLPPYYETSNVARAILGANAEMLNKVHEDNNDLLDQLYVLTATWGLDYWERDLELPTVLSYSYEKRRSLILAKMLARGQFTKYEARQLAQAFSTDGKAEYFPIPGEYAYGTRHNLGTLVSFDDMIDAFKEGADAHLEHLPTLYTEAVTTTSVEVTRKIVGYRVLDGSFNLDGTYDLGSTSEVTETI